MFLDLGPPVLICPIISAHTWLYSDIDKLKPVTDRFIIYLVKHSGSTTDIQWLEFLESIKKRFQFDAFSQLSNTKKKRD